MDVDDGGGVIRTVRLAVALQAGVAGGGAVEGLPTALVELACGGS